MNEIALRASGEIAKTWTANDVVGAIVDSVKPTGMMIPPAWRALIGKNAKLMLADDFPPETVIAACYLAIQRGRPELAQYIAGDLMLAQSGQSMSRTEYETKVALFAADKAQRPTLLEEQRERRAQRVAEIDERRRGNG